MGTLSLPIQLIHADLHYDNVLVDGDRVSGLLDFEFSVHDWRGIHFNKKYYDSMILFYIFVLMYIDYFITLSITTNSFNTILL